MLHPQRDVERVEDRRLGAGLAVQLHARTAGRTADALVQQALRAAGVQLAADGLLGRTRIGATRTYINIGSRSRWFKIKGGSRSSWLSSFCKHCLVLAWGACLGRGGPTQLAGRRGPRVRWAHAWGTVWDSGARTSGSTGLPLQPDMGVRTRV